MKNLFKVAILKLNLNFLHSMLAGVLILKIGSPTSAWMRTILYFATNNSTDCSVNKFRIFPYKEKVNVVFTIIIIIMKFLYYIWLYCYFIILIDKQLHLFDFKLWNMRLTPFTAFLLTIMHSVFTQIIGIWDFFFFFFTFWNFHPHNSFWLSWWNINLKLSFWCMYLIFITDV